jgi:hypothetical protein
MTVTELINKLRRMDRDMIVRFAYDYGDRSHTTTTQPVCKVEEQPCRFSEYHRAFTLLDGDRDTSNDQIETFVVLL